ncbi:MAG TPA: hypothetical protein PKC87_04280 [Candidatus Absconditabacterales bacterium]|nr:hypothetical protein [Candidatus Absconditabacterales bacterium]
MTSSEKHLSKSNNWKTFKSKLKTLGGAGALSILITLNACGPEDTSVKKAAERYQDATERVEKAKENLKNKEALFEDAQKALQEAEKEAINAKENLKQESSRL